MRARLRLLAWPRAARARRARGARSRALVLAPPRRTFEDFRRFKHTKRADGLHELAELYLLVVLRVCGPWRDESPGERSNEDQVRVGTQATDRRSSRLSSSTFLFLRSLRLTDELEDGVAEHPAFLVNDLVEKVVHRDHTDMTAQNGSTTSVDEREAPRHTSCLVASAASPDSSAIERRYSLVVILLEHSPKEVDVVLRYCVEREHAFVMVNPRRISLVTKAGTHDGTAPACAGCARHRRSGRHCPSRMSEVRKTSTAHPNARDAPMSQRPKMTKRDVPK